MTDKKGKIEDLIEITYSPVPGGVELFLKSERIHKFMKEQAATLGDGNQITTVSSSGSPIYLRGKKFHKTPSSVTGGSSNTSVAGPGDFLAPGNHTLSSCLLASTELGEGLTLKIQGMVARSALDAAAAHIKTTASSLYKSFMAPYTVRIVVATNEEC